ASYRSAPDSVYGTHAQLCFSRAGIARLGTIEPFYDARKRNLISARFCSLVRPSMAWIYTSGILTSARSRSAAALYTDSTAPLPSVAVPAALSLTQTELDAVAVGRPQGTPRCCARWERRHHPLQRSPDRPGAGVPSACLRDGARRHRLEAAGLRSAT